MDLMSDMEALCIRAQVSYLSIWVDGGGAIHGDEET